MTTLTRKMDGYDLPFRENVLLVIFDEKGHIFLGKNNPDHKGQRRPNIFALPTGGVDSKDPTYEFAAYREMLEEVGTDAVHFLGKHKEVFVEKFIDEGSKYTGRRLTTYLFLISDKSQIKINNSIDCEGPTFIDSKFVPLSELPDYGHESIKPVYKKVARTFAPIARAIPIPGMAPDVLRSYASLVLKDFDCFPETQTHPWRALPDYKGYIRLKAERSPT